jgi:hypothetical protein
VSLEANGYFFMLDGKEKGRKREAIVHLW